MILGVLYRYQSSDMISALMNVCLHVSVGF